MDISYTAIAHASGGGRDGHVRSDDDRIDFETRPPKELGGSGEGVNPEQLFAAAYSACYLGALHAAGKELGLDTKDASVSASVGIGKNDKGEGFAIAVELDIHAPHTEESRRQELAEKAHKICPYSNATRGNVDVKLTLVD
ncbi:organic hydroperoxide resistance protein [Salinibacterium sp. SYSU T00001]|uniref:organic hydroperoxide resistance protein n=1 Tax=Homoserinimonas sedimenticola TaxID=2986805 RepID=UPI002236A1FD|nr:organic hydroperoxide resistance protein [Salinibacterium sedimenticola]MCW4385540.1 organic hydroperoxide resistance protein [Salinibacterium sedimenticola]